MRADTVTSSYRRWAPVYDIVFGKLFEPGRRRATAFANEHGKRVLEVGVGTGIALPLYRPELEVVGVDYSEEMLAKAVERIAEDQLKNVSLQQMDAQAMQFPDASFDIVTAMHVLSVVPDPVQALSEMLRVCQPGGYILIVNHFAAERGILKLLEKRMAGLQNHLGWQADFPLETVLGFPGLEVVERRHMPPFGMMTWLALRKL